MQELKDLLWFETMEDCFQIAHRGTVPLILDTPDDGLEQLSAFPAQDNAT